MRTSPRPRRAAAPALLASTVLVLSGCAGVAVPGAAPTPDAAEVVDAADCAVEATFDGYGTGFGDLPPGPRAGAVPDGFEPAAAVECRVSWEFVEEPVPAPDLAVPGGTGTATPDVTGAPVPDPGAVVDVVRLDGDLVPLLDQLRRPDVVPQPDQACVAMVEFTPVLYLVDADGRAVRVQWPTDACGFLLDGARESLAELRETTTATLTLP